MFKAHLQMDGLEEINQITEIEIALEEERDYTMQSFLFNKYAKNFQGGATANFTRELLPCALLPKKYEVDEMVCVMWHL